MNLNGNNVKNIIGIEKKKLINKIIQSHIQNIEKKIIIASNSGYDYIWYNITLDFKYEPKEYVMNIIHILEKNRFYIRLFEPYLLQIIW